MMWLLGACIREDGRYDVLGWILVAWEPPFLFSPDKVFRCYRHPNPTRNHQLPSVSVI